MKSGLVNDVDFLLAEQIRNWPLLARGVESLRHAQMRSELVAGRELFVRHIPHRIGSTTAAVDAASVAKRPCFLCPSNLPKEEHGIPFDSEFAIYCNPFPILDRHLTIVSVHHRPQRIAGSIHAMLRLAEALSDSFIIYNGAQCGASAPDHMHFQASSRSIFPIERDARGLEGPMIPNYARNVFVVRSGSMDETASRLERLLAVLTDITRAAGEPLVNIAAFFDNGIWTVFLFPRSKHRPDVFFSGQLTVSPATIDLCGVLVTPIEKDFLSIDGLQIEKIFREVTLPDDAMTTALKQFAPEVLS